MTPSHKTRICLALLAVLAGMVSRLDANSVPSSGMATPAAYLVETGDSRSDAIRAPVTSTTAPMAMPVRYTGWAFPGSDDGDLAIEPPVVIPAKEIDIAGTSQIIQDLSIMGRIIEKNVLGAYGVRQTGWGDVFTGGPLRQDMGPSVLFPSMGRPKPLYIGGYGATFFIQVDFPLVPPPEEAQEEPARSEEDPVWAQTKRSLLEPRTTGTGPRAEDAGQPYSQGKVESFRRSLIATMKHGANIRVLESNEWLTFVVQGVGSSSPSPRQDPMTALPRGSAMSAGRSVMTLRATKADVDAYAKGQLNPAQFEQRVQAITY